MSNMSWLQLLEFIKCADEPTLLKLLEDEKTGKRRPNYLLRIYGRYSRMREQRERLELFQAKKPPQSERRIEDTKRKSY